MCFQVGLFIVHVSCRQYLDLAAESGIPLRRPNGMNRYGIIVDDSSAIDGAVSMSQLSAFCKHLVEDFIRPIGRLLFASNVGHGDDVDAFVFTIRYSTDGDVKLSEHSDASVYTMNVNVNALSEDQYGGSAVYFVDPVTSEKHEVQFEPGMALFHLGQAKHAALPIMEGGTRQNLVVWLFGHHGDVRIAPYDAADQMTMAQRWTKSGDTGAKEPVANPLLCH